MTKVQNWTQNWIYLHWQHSFLKTYSQFVQNSLVQSKVMVRAFFLPISKTTYLATNWKQSPNWFSHFRDCLLKDSKLLTLRSSCSLSRCSKVAFCSCERSCATSVCSFWRLPSEFFSSAASCFSASARTRLICSSEYFSIWWSSDWSLLMMSFFLRIWKHSYRGDIRTMFCNEWM